MNQIVPVLLFFALSIAVLTGLGLIYSAMATQVQQLNESFAQLARRCGGALVPGNIFTRPSLTFVHRGVQAKLNFLAVGGKTTQTYTQVQLDWRERWLRCEIYTQQMMHRLGKFLGVEDIEIGSPAFDRRYIISGSDRNLLRRLLTTEAQELIETLRHTSEHDSVYISIAGGKFVVRTLGLIETPTGLERLMRLALQLFDAMQIPLEEGITFLDGPVLRIPGENATLHISDEASAQTASCQICGDEILTDVVLCRACRTPHHHDCWNYYGRCSTYGCRSHQCYRPQAANKKRNR